MRRSCLCQLKATIVEAGRVFTQGGDFSNIRLCDGRSEGIVTLIWFVTNGSSFVSLKLAGRQYARSKELILAQDEGLAKTLQIMKTLAGIVAGDSH